ncbi:hypothetical protein K458DRAFT_436094 [Lentithecium fluviatile CBS 122367]|uniref:Uncharacterized protein n=1 Tax=Lentithecium fluviatile CBS 122367 TaxID=1168545 RepID=A0A6G1IJ82_9PLEO|nr:hypothetical protein K458DRAFT_436094 [Lentithecium fluviatile CBS 122367]
MRHLLKRLLHRERGPESSVPGLDTTNVENIHQIPITSTDAQTASQPTSTPLVANCENYDLTLLYEPADAHAARVDVVFMHGLTGDVTLLKIDIPNARIIAFGYDAYVGSFWGGAPKNRLTNHVQDLVGDLSGVRADSGTEHRKIIFVVHSLGSLVVERALQISEASAEPHLHQIESSMEGILFMGTPHAGGDLAPFRKAMAQCLRAAGKRVNVDIVETPKRESSALLDVEDWFGQWLRRCGDHNRLVQITCFFEVLELPVIARSFQDRDIQARADQFLAELFNCPYEGRKNLNHERVPGTCEWFTGHELFRHWNESEDARLLWVSADPGCGKSILAKYLVDRVLPGPQRTVCYLFFKDGYPDQQSATIALCSLRRQLFLQKPELLTEQIITRRYRDGKVFFESIKFARGNVIEAIHELPDTVDRVYNRMLVKSSNATKALKALQCVISAKRPLTVMELSTAIAIKQQHSTLWDFEEQMEPENRFQHTLRNLCSLILIIVNSRVFLLHQTAREFLLEKPGVPRPNGGHSVDLAHGQLSWKPSIQLSISNRVMGPSMHLETARIVMPNEPMTQIALRLVNMNDLWPVFRIPFKHYNEYYDGSTVLACLATDISLHLDSCLGFLQAVMFLVKTMEMDVNSFDRDGHRPLALAAHSGHIETVEFFLQVTSIILDANDFVHAVEGGHRAVVALLLRTGLFKVNDANDYRQQPLCAAAAEGRTEIVHLILSHEIIDVNGYGIAPRNALMETLYHGHDEATKENSLRQEDRR